jgi:hypothetical protein
MNGVLQIDPSTDEVSVVPIEDESDVSVGSENSVNSEKSEKNNFEKWEGGVIDRDNNLWCVPQNAKLILKITPEPA